MRGLHEVDRLASFFDIIYQDPVISQVKLIAEPWDIGEGGYQVGNFPQGWSEWNGKYRDTIRDYWRGAESVIGEFAERWFEEAPMADSTKAMRRSIYTRDLDRPWRSPRSPQCTARAVRQSYVRAGFSRAAPLDIR